MSQNLGLLLNIIVNVISSSILGIAYGWKLGLTLVATGIPLVVASGYIRVRLDQRLETMTEKQYSSSASLATEAITSIRTISTSGSLPRARPASPTFCAPPGTTTWRR